MVGAGCQSNTTTSTDTKVEQQAGIFSQGDDGKLWLSNGYTLTLPVGVTVSDNSNVKLAQGDLSIPSLIDVTEWLKGPDPADGYVIAHEQRPAAIAVLESIYQHRNITEADKKSFGSVVGEFMGYSSEWRVALRYLESNDGAWRGITFVNLQGQEPGAYPVYYVTLYNSELKMVLSGLYSVSYENSEIKALNDPIIKAWDQQVGGAVIGQLDQNAKQSIKTKLETTRSKVSFSADLDVVDGIVKSIGK